MFLRKRAASLLRNKYFKLVNLLKKSTTVDEAFDAQKSISGAETFFKADSISFPEFMDCRTLEILQLNILHQITLCYCHECS